MIQVKSLSMLAHPFLHVRMAVDFALHCIALVTSIFSCFLTAEANVSEYN